jgi:hypothetical protein
VHWFVEVTLYPDAHAGRDYSWTIGAFEPDLGRFLREEEHVEPDSTGGYLPEWHLEDACPADREAVELCLKKPSAKVDELIYRERQLMRFYHRQYLKRQREEAGTACQPSAAVA